MVNLPLSWAKTEGVDGAEAAPFFWAAIVKVVHTKRIAIMYVKILGFKSASCFCMVPSPRQFECDTPGREAPNASSPNALRKARGYIGLTVGQSREFI